MKWQKVLTPKTQPKAPFRHEVAKGANPQNAENTL